MQTIFPESGIIQTLEQFLDQKNRTQKKKNENHCKTSTFIALHGIWNT